MNYANRSLNPAISSPNLKVSRKFIPTAVGACALMLGFFVLPSIQAAPCSLWLNDITEGSSWSLNLGNVLSYDSSTGGLTMPETAPTGWSWTQVPVYDPTSGTLVNQNALTSMKGSSAVTIYATGSADPFLSYGFAVSNPTTSVQTYTFTDGEAVTPSLSGAYNLFADIGGSVTNTPVTGGPAQVIPIASSVQTLGLSSDGGLTFTDAGTDVGPSFTTGISPGTYSYGVYSSSLSGVGSSVNYWQLEDQFSLTGNGDSAAFTGFAELDANTSIVIPEPSVYAALLGVMSLGVVLLRRNKHRSIKA
ncbi:MAG: PEP-CTERM sorting domain-containing protein [Opitutaceae bacterium]|jgi:hypothetical protein